MFTGWLCRSRLEQQRRRSRFFLDGTFDLTGSFRGNFLSQQEFPGALRNRRVAMPIATRTLPSVINSRSRRRRRFAPLIVGLGLAALIDGAANAADVYLPIVMPITGFLSVEGGSQRNGAVMALENAPSGLKAEYPIFDTGTSATGAATALDKALSAQKAIAAAVTVFGTEMVAMMPVAAEYKVPLLTISASPRSPRAAIPTSSVSCLTTAKSRSRTRAMSLK
jgi:hypothetical protein